MASLIEAYNALPASVQSAVLSYHPLLGQPAAVLRGMHIRMADEVEVLIHRLDAIRNFFVNQALDEAPVAAVRVTLDAMDVTQREIANARHAEAEFDRLANIRG